MANIHQRIPCCYCGGERHTALGPIDTSRNEYTIVTIKPCDCKPIDPNAPEVCIFCGESLTAERVAYLDERNYEGYTANEGGHCGRCRKNK